MSGLSKTLDSTTGDASPPSAWVPKQASGLRRRKSRAAGLACRELTLLSSTFRHQPISTWTVGMEMTTFDYKELGPVARVWENVPALQDTGGFHEYLRYSKSVLSLLQNLRVNRAQRAVLSTSLPFSDLSTPAPASVHSLGSISVRQFRYMSPNSEFHLLSKVA
ncbi:hypothetical protein ARMSODRAFT_164852 [Armillaria solidipes]|uniref:Uncharacterized protein n=1 Tax=Armillaria solidipes TaxID=1076256 RepID=A0A2H3BZZ4_9AGAR|nr:hypothetical protein ARMSODRAFT_164852 [Armillaria solidipes]